MKIEIEYTYSEVSPERAVDELLSCLKQARPQGGGRIEGSLDGLEITIDCNHAGDVAFADTMANYLQIASTLTHSKEVEKVLKKYHRDLSFMALENKYGHRPLAVRFVAAGERAELELPDGVKIMKDTSELWFVLAVLAIDSDAKKWAAGEWVSLK